MSKFCTNCGAQMDDEALFCVECGTRYEEPVVTAQPEQTAAPTQFEQPAEPPVQPTEFENQNPYMQPEQTTRPAVEQTPYAQPAQPVYQQPTQPTPPPQNYYQPNQPPYGQNYYQQQPVQYASQPAVKQKKPGKGFGIASMILGIVAAVNSLFLLLLDMTTGLFDSVTGSEAKVAAFGIGVAINIYAGFICFLALLSLIFGIVSLVKGNRGTAIAGLILTGLSIAVCIFSFVLSANLDKASLSEVIEYGEKEKNNSSYSFNFDDDDKYNMKDLEDQLKDILD